MQKNLFIRNYLPVVMHGGSGVSEEDYHQAIAAGVRKINDSRQQAICFRCASDIKEDIKREMCLSGY